MSTPSSDFAEMNFEALGTRCHVIFYGTAYANNKLARDFVLSEIERYDAIFSVYRSDSEITRVNVSNSQTLTTSRDFAELTALYIEKYRSSNGLVDPTKGFELIELYRSSNPLVAIGQESHFFRSVNFGEFSVKLTPHSDTGQIRRPVGAFMDFGGLGKAWIADRVANLLITEYGGGVLVNLGGDIATDGQVPPDGWTIKVTDDFSLDATAPGWSVRIFGGGLATSSTATRRWRDSSGNERLHVVGENIEKSTIVTVTAVGVCAFEANYQSLSALVAGDGAVPWLMRSKTPSLVRTLDGRGLAVSGWPTTGEITKDDLIGAN